MKTYLCYRTIKTGVSHPQKRAFLSKLFAVFLMLILLNGCSSAEDKPIEIRAFEFNSSGLKVITTTVNEKAGTMSILYGNESALRYSKTRNENHVAGEVFKLVTYEQQDHEFWYGSKINGALVQVETIKIIAQGAGTIPQYSIETKGKALSATSSLAKKVRIEFILDQKAALFP